MVNIMATLNNPIGLTTLNEEEDDDNHDITFVEFQKTHQQKWSPW